MQPRCAQQPDYAYHAYWKPLSWGRLTRGLFHCMSYLASSPDHSQILSRSCGEKSGVAWGQGYLLPGFCPDHCSNKCYKLVILEGFSKRLNRLFLLHSAFEYNGFVSCELVQLKPRYYRKVLGTRGNHHVRARKYKLTHIAGMVRHMKMELSPNCCTRCGLSHESVVVYGTFMQKSEDMRF